MKIIPGGIADQKGKKFTANIETMEISGRYSVESVIGLTSDSDFKGNKTRWEDTIDNPLIARKGDIY